MNEEQWHAKARQEAFAAITKIGGAFTVAYTTDRTIIPFSYGGELYYLQYNISEDVTTRLPLLVWSIHKELARAGTALEVLGKQLR
jgi:hypothetical protein